MPNPYGIPDQQYLQALLMGGAEQPMANGMQPQPKPPVGVGGLTPQQMAQIQALTGLGDRDAMLQKQMAQGEAFMRPMGGPPPLTGKAAIFSGLADALRGTYGAYRQSSAMKDREKLLADALAGRKDFSGALGGAQSELSAASQALMGLAPDAPGYQEAAGRYQAATGKVGDLGRFGAGIGDPTLAALSQGALGQTKQSAAEVLGLRKEAKAEAQQKLDNAWKGRAVSAAENKGPNDHFSITNNPDGSQTKLNTLTGEETRIPAPAGGGQASGEPNPLAGLKPEQVQKLWTEFKVDLSTVKGRGNENVKNQSRLYSIGRLNGLIEKALSGRGVTPQEQAMIDTDVASVYAGGGSPAQAQIEHLHPDTFQGSMAKALQYATGHPEDTGAQEFIKRTKDNMRDLRVEITRQMLSGQEQTLPLHLQRLRKSNPKQFDNMLTAAGIAPDTLDLQTGLPLAATPDTGSGPNVGAPAMVAPTNPEDTKALAWAQAHREDPRSQEILKRLGAAK